MPTPQLLDPLPIVAVFVVFALVTMACYEGGFRLGRWWQVGRPGSRKVRRACSSARSWRSWRSSSR